MERINRLGANLNVNVARLGNLNAANAYKAVEKETESLKMNLNKVDCFVKTTAVQQTKEEEVFTEKTPATKKGEGKGKGKGKGKEGWKNFVEGVKDFIQDVTEWFKNLANEIRDALGWKRK